METFELGQEVVRSKGDYVVGRIGKIVEIDNDKKRARVDWVGETKTWVSFSVVAKTSIPYRIDVIEKYSKRAGRTTRTKVYVQS